jgi:hypothetical protein
MADIYIDNERYDYLIELEARVDVIITIIARGGYISKDDLLAIIGTDRAMDILGKIEDKEIDIPCMRGEEITDVY